MMPPLRLLCHEPVSAPDAATASNLSRRTSKHHELAAERASERATNRSLAPRTLGVVRVVTRSSPRTGPPRSLPLLLVAGLLPLVLVVTQLAALGSCFPQGAPTEVCDSMLPRHVGTQPSSESSPFYLSASSGSYGGVFGYNKARGIKVELGGAPFKGFFIVAIDPKTGQRIGSWAQVKGTNVLPCAGITHTNGKTKKYASLLWLPPPHEQGFVTFIGTVVQSFSKYYMNLVATSPEQPQLEASPGGDVIPPPHLPTHAN